jgi:cytochrome d ubiquinol oxidase subunit I
MLESMMTLPLANNLLAAREQMAFTLGFHIILASMGVAFPAITLIANWRGLRHRDDVALELARRWSKTMAVLFAVGAVTGTVLSFEMGLLWPGLMGRYGSVLGVGFAIEGIFFFTEAIFIAIYLYGWKRLSPWAHFWSGVPIVIAGIGGALSVVSVNSWMNQPAGFTVDAAGKVTHVAPLKAIFNDASLYEIPHMILAAYMVAGFLVASVYAAGWLRGRRDRHHRLGFAIPFTLAALVTPVQLFVGDTAARGIADHQPAKFAAMEYVSKTGTHQPEWILGYYKDGDVKLGIKIPDLDSILVGFRASKEVIGLDRVRKRDHPPAPTLLHLAFQVMVGIGSALLLLGVWFALAWRKRRGPPQSLWFWRVASLSGLGAVVALECGWIVTEVGRQPWIVWQRLRTSDAVTTAHGIWWVFAGTVLLYAVLGAVTILLLRGLARRWQAGIEREGDVPYGPPQEAETAG